LIQIACEPICVRRLGVSREIFGEYGILYILVRSEKVAVESRNVLLRLTPPGPKPLSIPLIRSYHSGGSWSDAWSVNLQLHPLLCSATSTLVISRSYIDSNPMEGTSQRPSVYLPQDLTCLIAGFVDADDDGKRIPTLKNCMLVSQSFACEFQPHLFRTLYILDPDADSDDIDTISDRLDTHWDALERHTEYRKLVKEVVIELYLDEKDEELSLSESPHFPSWLEHLTAVSSVTLGPRFNNPIVYDKVPNTSQDAIFQLCSRPSISHLTFDNIRYLPARTFNETPNLLYISLGSIAMKAERITKASVAISENGAPLHLDIPHYDIGQSMANAWVLDNLFKRVWKLSGLAAGPIMGAMLTMVVQVTKENLRELDIIIGSGMSFYSIIS
jgi:hypothetical protein